MPTPADNEALKLVRKEVARRPIDISHLTFTVTHGVVYFHGQVRGMRGHILDVKEEMLMIAKILRQRPQIRDVVMDLVYRL